MTVCCFMTLLTVFAVIGIVCLIAILIMAIVLHFELKNILRTNDDYCK